jgi:hypothetical protein
LVNKMKAFARRSAWPIGVFQPTLHGILDTHALPVGTPTTTEKRDDRR